ncbi:MAG: 4-hydroxythreonine-4-phosphate dehydrogenase PdxA [Tannerellaceae bacterium]|nr:4-hydroxythreonine-4-phosphate dehydrogenase PdxA [Tannerellaceae bacterium]
MIKIAITASDINNIGYESVLMAFSDTRMTDFCIPIVYGSPKTAGRINKTLEIPVPGVGAVSRAEDAAAGRINIINCAGDKAARVDVSEIADALAQASPRGLRAAVDDLKRGAVDIIITAPASGSAPTPFERLPQEYMDCLSAGGAREPLFMILGEGLRVVQAALEESLTGGLPHITKDGLTEQLTSFNHSLKEDFGIVRPRLAVVSQHPHEGGRNGASLSAEDNETVVPAIKDAEDGGAIVFGPYEAGRFFEGRMYERFDGILVTYCEAGAEPFDTLSAGSSFCYTAGLSAIHMSPVAGSASETGDRGPAAEDSLRQAVYAAVDIYRNRKRQREYSRNPLRRQYFDKSGADETVDLTKDDGSDL